MWLSRLSAVLFLVSLSGVMARDGSQADAVSRPYNMVVEENQPGPVFRDDETNAALGTTDPYKAASKVVDGDYIYTMWEHIYVKIQYESTRESRHVILLDVPFSGFYKFYVQAGYSTIVGPGYSKEEYRLCIVDENGQVNVGPIIPDQNGNDPQSPGDYDEIWNDHGFQYLHKGDNEIFFRIGDQTVAPNPVSIHRIRLSPPPHIVPEPEFTANYSNTIKWMPIVAGAYSQDVFYFDAATGMASVLTSTHHSLSKANIDTFNTAVFSNLVNGHKYGYYVEAATAENGIVRSDTTYSTQDASPPGLVTIADLNAYWNKYVEIYWDGVIDLISGVNFYEIQRLEDNNGQTTIVTIDTVWNGAGCAAGSFEYCYTDTITDPDAAHKIYKYRVDAIDNVGNRSTGRVSELVIEVPAPALATNPGRVENRFYKGPRVLASAINIADLTFPESHVVRFQAARDSIKFLEDQFQPNKFFFESGWLPVRSATFIDYLFDLTNNGGNTLNFIDGHTYYLRAQYRDAQGNLSEWTAPDTMGVIPDCFPPDDITFLTITPTTNAGKTEGWMDIKWGGAIDRTSGIDSFYVYRRVAADSGFRLVAKVTDTSYIDSFESINYNGDVTYRIGSVDKVGNKRAVVDTYYEATARSSSAPTFRLLAEEVIDGVKYTTSRDVFLSCRLDSITSATDVKILVQMNGAQKTLTPVRNLNLYSLLLPENYDTYTIRLQVLFANKSTTLWSKADSIQYVEKLPNQPLQGSPETDNPLQAANYPNPFNLSTRISYQLQTDAYVTVEVYNVQGRLIRTLTSERKNKGAHVALWNGENSDGRVVSSGIYYFKILTEDDNNTRANVVQRMLLVK